MGRRLISERVWFRYDVNYRRWWLVNGDHHRSDGDPAYESMRTGYRQWWERGKLVRDNREASVGW